MSQEMETQARKVLATLDAKRRSLEMEADGIVFELTAETPEGGRPMGIDTPLVDEDGYPRGDIDIYRARTLRQRLSVIRTDHKILMKEIEQGLANLLALKQPAMLEEDQAELQARMAPKPKPKFDPVTGKWVVMNWDGSVAGVKDGEHRSFHSLESDTALAAAGALHNSTSTTADQNVAELDLQPFAVIDSILSTSPAEKAGLKEGDLVLEFGTANHTNHRHLLAIGEIVPMAAGNQEGIAITVLRESNNGERARTKLTLHPQPWAGRGMLGCHITKYEGG